MPALLMMILNNPTLMAIITPLISNPAIVDAITKALGQLSTQIGAGVPVPTAMQNLMLTQFDLEGAADVVHAYVAKMALPAWTRDQERELAALVIRSYIANVKAGK